MTVVLLAVSSVVLSAVAQLALKTGMMNPEIQSVIASGASPIELATRVATNPFVVAGLGLYGAGAVVWLMVLAEFDLSKAYPFVGLGFVLTALFGVIALGEHMSAWRAAGTALVVVGVLMVAHS